MQNGNKKSPQGWCVTSLGEIAAYVNGRAFKPTEWEETGKPIIRIQNLNDQDAKFNYSSMIHEDKYLVNHGDLLFAWSASLGAYIWNGQDAWLNQHIFKVHPLKCVDKKFLYYLLTDVTAGLYAKAHGSGMVHVTKGKFEATSVFLPPLSEQHRIVAKIEALFSELDKGIESFKTAREQLKIYRQALLKHAFSGKLTEQWRAENQTKLESAETLLERIQTERQQRYQQQLKDWEASDKQGSKPKAPKTLLPLTAEELAELPALPVEWATIKIDGLLSLEKKTMTTGPFGTALKKNEHRPSGIPVLGIENIGNGIFIHGNKIFVSEEKGKELESFSVEANDIVISRSGTVGEICKVPDSLGKAYISTNLIRVSLNQKVINPDFFVYLFQSGSFVKEQVKNLCKGSSREFLNQTILSSLAFPLPSLEEQYQIVSEIDSRASMADQLDQTITAALQQAEALRQSILKKAFSGQLVPQDPNEEPASVLLERISTERVQCDNKSPNKVGEKKHDY